MLLISYLWAANRSFYLIPRCPSLLWPRRCATLGVVHTEGHWVRTELCSALFASCCRPLLPGATPTSGKLALRSRTSRKISGMALSSCYFWKSSQVSLNIFCRCYTHFVWAVDIYASVFFFVFFFFFKKAPFEPGWARTWYYWQRKLSKEQSVWSYFSLLKEERILFKTDLLK